MLCEKLYYYNKEGLVDEIVVHVDVISRSCGSAQRFEVEVDEKLCIYVHEKQLKDIWFTVDLYQSIQCKLIKICVHVIAPDNCNQNAFLI